MSSSRRYQPVLNQPVQILTEHDPNQTHGVITNFLTDQFVVRFPNHHQFPVAFVPGMSIEIRCPDATGLHVAKTQVVELCSPPRPGIVVKMPASFDLIQKRRFFRVEVDFPCILQALSPTGSPLAKGLDTQARIRDLSAGGARVLSTCPLVVGDPVQLEFVPNLEAAKSNGPASAVPAPPLAHHPKPIPPIAITPAAGVPQTCPVNSPTLQLAARVVRNIPATSDFPNLSFVGVEFERMSSRTQDRIVTLIFDLQRAQANRR